MQYKVGIFLAVNPNYLYMTRADNKSKMKGYDGVADNVDVRKDALVKRDNIIAEERVATEFFFNEMLPKMAALAESYNRAYGLYLTPEDVCTVTYLSCWEDNWAKLVAFKGETTIHAWVSKIASQATYRFLVDEKYIDGVGNTKTNDYRLTVRGIEDVGLRQTIVDLVFIPEQHEALEMYYVKKLDEAAFVRAFGSVDKGKEVLKVAEKTLIEQLLNTENPYAEVALSTKKNLNPEIHWQTWHDRIDEGDVSENHQAFRELLSQLYHCEDWDENVRTLVESVINSLDWNEIQIEVWRERFFNDTPSKELAERFHVRNTWIDNTYSRLNKLFRIAVKTWWNNNN